MSLEKSRKDSNKIIEGIDKTGDKVKRSSKKLYNKAIDKVIDQNIKNPPFTANSLVAKSIDNDLRKILDSTEESYDKFIKAQQRYLSSNYSIDLSKTDLNILVSKKSDLIDELVTNTTILKEDIKAILFANLGRGVPQARLARLLKDLYPAYARNANTIVNTGIGKTYIDTNVAKFQQSNLKWYLYAGPDDKVTRDIPCKHWVNRAFPASQLNIVSSTRLSLFNCRHNIIAITEDEAKDLPKLDTSFA